MTRKKRTRFAELREFPNVFERETVSGGGAWIREHFGNDHPLILELGCGRGEYTLALARRYRDHNVIGVDRKGARLWKGARKALDEGLQNAAFVRIKIEDLLDVLETVQVEEIWIPFPDPLPKRKQAKHRMISRTFLDSYRALLKKDGRVHFKTDNEGLFQFLLSVLADYPVIIHRQEDDLHARNQLDALTSVQTTYERRHLEDGKTIKYLCFSFLEDGQEAGEVVEKS